MSELIVPAISLFKTVVGGLYQYYEKEGYTEGFSKFYIIMMSVCLIMGVIGFGIYTLKEIGWINFSSDLQSVIEAPPVQAFLTENKLEGEVIRALNNMEKELKTLVNKSSKRVEEVEN